MACLQCMRLRVSAKHLYLLAALVWIIGGLILLLKAGQLLSEAWALRPHDFRLGMALLAGMGLGTVKILILFRKACHRNLERIDSLESPRIWQFYRPRFFIFLTAMVLLGAFLSHQAHGRYGLLLGVAALDLSLAIALLGSCPVFWSHRSKQTTNQASSHTKESNI